VAIRRNVGGGGKGECFSLSKIARRKEKREKQKGDADNEREEEEKKRDPYLTFVWRKGKGRRGKRIILLGPIKGGGTR